MTDFLSFLPVIRGLLRMLKFACAVVYLSVVGGCVYGFNWLSKSPDSANSIQSAYLIQPAGRGSAIARSTHISLGSW
jgi:hypothetical protein